MTRRCRTLSVIETSVAITTTAGIFLRRLSFLQHLSHLHRITTSGITNSTSLLVDTITSGWDRRITVTIRQEGRWDPLGPSGSLFLLCFLWRICETLSLDDGRGGEHEVLFLAVVVYGPNSDDFYQNYYGKGLALLDLPIPECVVPFTSRLLLLLLFRAYAPIKACS